ncbi:MAG: CHASE2 domain-containing protein, partial [Verrucomicrobia bacterium]
LAALVAILGFLFRERFVGDSYDALHSFTGQPSGALSNSPVVIVYLDLNSFAALQHDPARPWPRELHARLLRQLTADGAKAVVFDIVFSGAGADPVTDSELAQAIRESGRTILAGEASGKISHQTGDENVWLRASKVVPPLAWFATNAVAWGIASHMIDDDYVVRNYLAGGFGAEQQGSLTWATANWLRLPVTQSPDAMRRANAASLRYYGPPTTIPHVSYAQALAPDGTPPDFFRDKIVFIGARPITGLFQERKDEFRSPFHSWANRELFMPGVEVHATEFLNLLRGDGLNRLSASVESFLLLTVAVLFGCGLIWLRPLPATVAAFAGVAGVAGLALVGFGRGIYAPWLVVAGVQIPVALFGSWLYQFQNWFFVRRHLEAAKRSADARIREQAALIDKAHDAILVQDLGGKVLYANPSAEKLFGWSLAEFQQDGVTEEMFSAESAAVITARAAALTSGEWSGELKQRTRSGRIVVVDSRWTLIRDDDGAPKALLLIGNDVTEKKELEAQFLRTQRMNTIGTLAGGIAHDLNNALAPILMGVQLLRRKSTDTEAKNLLGLMETNTLRGADMVRQVLLFARGRGGELERLELAPLVKELEKLVRETFPKNISVESFLPKDLWPVRGNPTQLHQVLLNLCVNARDAMPEGGKLSFVADNVELTEAEAGTIPAGAPGEFVSLLVSDSGTGMPPEVLAKIFEPFFTTKGEGRGTGIGLATVMRLVKSHGGFLRVESEPGQGTSFEIFLPRAVTLAPVAQSTRAVELPRGRGELILVADDERAIRELLVSELGSFGYRVLAAQDGAEAVQLFREHAGEVRLLLTDGEMPVLDGPRAIAEIRSLRADLPVVLASGEADDGEASDRHGIARLRKPFSLDEVLKLIREKL